MFTKIIYAITTLFVGFGSLFARAESPNLQIRRCIDLLTSNTRPHGRAKVFAFGSAMHDFPELASTSHAVLMMEQTTSHNHLMLFKPIDFTTLVDLKRRVIHVPPTELTLIEMSPDERRGFADAATEVGSVSLTAPPRKHSALEFDPTAPGTLLSVDGRAFVVVQCVSESNFTHGTAVLHASTHTLVALPGTPEKGMTATEVKTLRIEADNTFYLNDRPVVEVKNVGQAAVQATMLINAADGPRLKVELLEVMTARSRKLVNALELTIKGFRTK